METIGDKIRKLIKDKEMTQEELARKADIPYSTLIKIISGNVDNPTIRTIQKLAVALDVSVDELLTTIRTKT
ncbi:helix-turn-helix transcriptional regulator [Candidatus Dojkabacteria bacterium]|uniref:Helix-turn-helix transcriptional regulator n=1 Tax=Candidatus Dojkabacteria bacterium TaxID=2099670 RepID=A0A955IAU5_9BACT|nr:helix-turn-helix transcriptional regulator [Candidatus Dojkabacteria bacterium]